MHTCISALSLEYDEGDYDKLLVAQHAYLQLRKGLTRVTLLNCVEHRMKGKKKVGLIMRAFDETNRDFEHLRIRRDDGLPYISHPLAMAILGIEHLHIRDPEVIIAILLHDNLEDLTKLGWSFKRIAEVYGYKVALLVYANSKHDIGLFNYDAKARKSEFLFRLVTLTRTSATIRLLDRIDNLATLGAQSDDVLRQLRKIQETIRYYIPLALKHGIFASVLTNLLLVAWRGVGR